MPNILSLTRTLSGASISDIQATANKLYACTGSSESQTGTVYGAPANTITDGQSHETALTELADKFDPTTGHTHDGSDGNGGPISSSSITSTALLTFIIPGSTITGVTGGSTDVSSLMSGKIPSSNSTTAGVIVNTPYNRVYLTHSDAGVFGDEIVDATGNIVYGRLTYAASVWTLTYYSIISGVETPFTFGSDNLRWFFRELFNPIISTSPVYNPFFELPYKTVKSYRSNSNAALYGDVQLTSTGGSALTQTGQAINIDSPALSSTTAPSSIGSSNTVGSGTTSARADHIHQGVHSVSKSGSSQLFADVTFTAGSNITLTQTANDITIDATTAVTTVGTIDSQSKSANGAVISVPNIYFQTADTSFPGLVSILNQSFSGVKTFVSAISTPTFYLTGSVSGTLTQQAAATTTDYTIIWPAAQSSGTQVLANDGAGNLSWTTAATGTVSTVGTIDSVSKSANGAVISGSNIIFQSADGSFPGMVTTTTQTLAGDKTFSTSISTPTSKLTGSTSGTLTMTATAVTTDYSLIWPAAQGGSDSYLNNDGSGNLSWKVPSTPTTQTFAGGSSGTYTTPAGVKYLIVTLVGAGGGGGGTGSSTSGGTGTTGGDTTFDSLTAGGGTGGNQTGGGSGGAATGGGDLPVSGGIGGPRAAIGTAFIGGSGGMSFMFGIPGQPGEANGGGGGNADGFGAGGGGGGCTVTASPSGGGGGGGAFIQTQINSPSATYSYSVGTGGGGGSAGTSGVGGGGGANGVLIVKEFYI